MPSSKSHMYQSPPQSAGAPKEPGAPEMPGSCVDLANLDNGQQRHAWSSRPSGDERLYSVREPVGRRVEKIRTQDDVKNYLDQLGVGVLSMHGKLTLLKTKYV
ncbi:unnamed protein product [Cylicostephanus goldi]|uniref:Uncharacterized protein n=1 Tax=Cylicostephanus goldi TaxID=71465 RepID=A0A3P7MXQ5_CYLGO|nr:unnamed protein product [Cylicostephanus goldi]